MVDEVDGMRHYFFVNSIAGRAMSPKPQRTNAVGEPAPVHGALPRRLQRTRSAGEPVARAPRHDAVRARTSSASAPLKALFLDRASKAVADLADRLDPSELQTSIAGESWADTLLRGLSQPGAIGFVRPEVDALARARVRGLQRRDDLLAAEGGTLTTQAVARHLGLTPQAVHKRRNAGKLLALELGRRGLRFPAWQFADDGVLAGLEEVLRALEDAPPLAVVRFFLSGNARLVGKRPLDRLRLGDPAPVIAAARAFDLQGAV
jgi:hypothetical protein